jgi:hypothetical protein
MELVFAEGSSPSSRLRHDHHVVRRAPRAFFALGVDPAEHVVSRPAAIGGGGMISNHEHISWEVKYNGPLSRGRKVCADMIRPVRRNAKAAYKNSATSRSASTGRSAASMERSVADGQRRRKPLESIGLQSETSGRGLLVGTDGWASFFAPKEQSSAGVEGRRTQKSEGIGRERGVGRRPVRGAWFASLRGQARCRMSRWVGLAAPGSTGRLVVLPSNGTRPTSARRG